VAPADIAKISVKYNSSSTPYNVSPMEISSEAITALTASSSSTAVVNLYWRALYS